MITESYHTAEQSTRQTRKQRKRQKTKLRHYEVSKRTLDIVFALMVLVITLPLFIVIAAILKGTEPKAKIIFQQKRIGQHGKSFRILKFRTMKEQADEWLKNDPKLYEKYITNDYKLLPEEDPRITKFGLLLRKTSLDEIPQLINIIKGDMSFVGPRPVVSDELAQYGEKKQQFLAVKPGLTGYWQVNGRSEVGYPERVNLELHYVSHQSFLLDIKIVWKTIFVVLRKKGAY
jgi:exopolysaccharide production protein ExoY